MDNNSERKRRSAMDLSEKAVIGTAAVLGAIAIAAVPMTLKTMAQDERNVGQALPAPTVTVTVPADQGGTPGRTGGPGTTPSATQGGTDGTAPGATATPGGPGSDGRTTGASGRDQGTGGSGGSSGSRRDAGGETDQGTGRGAADSGSSTRVGSDGGTRGPKARHDISSGNPAPRSGARSKNESSGSQTPPRTWSGMVDWSASDCDGTLVHLVWGDTLSKISANHGTPVRDLARINKVVDPDLIYAGEDLCVPYR